MRIILCMFIVLACNLRNVYAHHGALSCSVATFGNNGYGLLQKGTWNINVQTQTSFFEPINHNSDKPVMDLKNFYLNQIQLTYGLTNRMGLSVRIPYIFFSGALKSESMNNVSSDYGGFGDVSLMGSYCFLKKETTFLTGIIGIELPTGHVENGILSIYQLYSSTGSGTYDAIAGLMFTKQISSWNITSNYYQTFTGTNAEGYNYGNNSIAGIRISKMFENGCSKDEACQNNETCICPKDNNSNSFLAFGGIQYEYLQAQKFKNSAVYNTGNTRLFLNMGCSLNINDQMNVPLQLDIPVFQKINGYQNFYKQRFSIGFNLNIK